MPRFFILLGLIAVAFVALMFVPGSSEQPPQNREDYEASGIFAWIGEVAASRPGYKLQGTPFDIAANQRRDVLFRAGREGERRLVKLTLVSGAAARVRYGDKTLCLVVGGANPPGCRGKPRTTGSFPLQPAAGMISIEALGAPVRVESR
jgi:hypothetical protein